MKPLNPESVRRIALVNFGGIGDEILFCPVIQGIRKYFPDAHITLFLEDRSAAVVELLPGVDATVKLSIQKKSRPKVFLELVGRLRGKNFDIVISSGSSPFIPVMLWLTGIPVRVGFQTGGTSKALLTVEAPLDRRAYAGEMYYSLARATLKAYFPSDYVEPEAVLPVLQPPSEANIKWAEAILGDSQEADRKRLMIHPGVSLVSIEKNIFKGWSAYHWAAFIQQMAECDDIYLVGGPDDAEIIREILEAMPERLAHFRNLYGKTKNLGQLAALIHCSDILVAVDSSPLHIAVGLGKPVVAMFGPTDEKKLLPVHPDVRAVTRSDLVCRPCLWDVRQTNCEASDCLNVEIQSMVEAITGVPDRTLV